MQAYTREAMAARDRADPLRDFRAQFVIPDGLIYLDGNSLGMLPRVCIERAARVVEQEWGRTLISSWNDHGWIDLPLRVGAAIAPLIGADADEVVACDSTSINLFKVLASAAMLRPGRKVIVTNAQNFPTDIYIAEGLCRLLGDGYALRHAEPDQLGGALGADVAAVAYSHVDFKSARIEDMAGLTAKIHQAGALAVWDLSHSAGAVPVALNAAQADFAVGCGYKYLNGGPGAPAFLFAARRHHASMQQPLSGWLGHARPFGFTSAYEPAPGIKRMITGTPAVISMSVLEAAIGIVADAGIARLREKSMAMTQLLIDLVAQQCAGHSLTLASPTDAAVRGSHVIFAHDDGYAIVQALKARGVVGDFRAPNFIRLGIAPIYLSFVELWDAVARFRQVMANREWDTEQFRTRAAVT
jgi:kynureninase